MPQNIGMLLSKDQESKYHSLVADQILDNALIRAFTEKILVDDLLTFIALTRPVTFACKMKAKRF